MEAAQTVLENALAGKASQDDLDALATRIAAIETSLADALVNGGVASISYVDAATQNLEAQINVFEKYRQALLTYLGLTDDDAAIEKVKNLVESLKAAVQKIGSFPADDLTAEEVAAIRKVLEGEDGHINVIITEANILQFLLNKQLTGLVAMPKWQLGGVEAVEVPAMYYNPVIVMVGEGADEEFHYVDPNSGKVFDEDLFNGTSAYLFDEGSMAPKMKIPAHSWAEFVAKYGEGSTGSILQAYKDFVSGYTSLQTSKTVAEANMQYLVNPSSVNLDNVSFSFYTNTRLVEEQVESRVGNDNFARPVQAKFSDGKVNTLVDGVLTVPFTIPAWEAYVHQLARTADGNYVKNPWAPKGDPSAAEFATLTDSVNFIALQAHIASGKTDTIVSSDFVAVVPALIHVQALADNNPETKILNCGHYGGWTGVSDGLGLGGHMWKLARTAIAKPATHSVAYNKTLDILPFIEIHASHIGAASTRRDFDNKMDAETFKLLGLKYRFGLVDYFEGGEKTSESEHLTLEVTTDVNAPYGLASVIAIPRSVDAQGNKMDQERTTQEAVDREPLIRIELLDRNNQVVEIGYMKLIITDREESTFCAVPIEENYYMNCADEHGLTWSQMENLVLRNIGAEGISKAQFEAEYELETYVKNADGSNVKGKPAMQFTSYLVDGERKYTGIADVDTLGTIRYTTSDSADKMTNVLNWYVSENTAQVAKEITGPYIKIERDADGNEITSLSEIDQVANAAKLLSAEGYAKLSATEKGEYRLITAAEARTALIASKGQGYEGHDLVRTVRFVKKNVSKSSKSAVYVELRIAGVQIYFAYSEVGNKDKSHWYQLNSALKGSEVDHNAFEVHQNVKVPAEEGDNFLELDDFNRDLLKWFTGNPIKNFNEKFDKYGKNAQFRFVLPKAGLNAEFGTQYDNDNGYWYWTVNGYSKKHGGLSQYRLHLAGETVEPNGEISYKEIRDQNNNRIVYILGTTLYVDWTNEAANDILNWAGYRDENGNKVEDKDFEYGETFGNIISPNVYKNLQAFTAYMEIYSQDGSNCYNLLLRDRFFNVKFMRPISVWPKNLEWIDAENKDMEVYVRDLLNVTDHRDFTVNLKKKEDNGSSVIGFGYYGISELFAPIDEIMTDHAVEPAYREALSELINVDPKKNKLLQQDIIEIIDGTWEPKTDDIKKYIEPLRRAIDLPALTDALKSNEKPQDALNQSRITYHNNSGNVQEFHLFVPIYVKYLWGEGQTWNVWTYDGSHAAKTFNPSTFKVWSVITVKGTTGKTE